jgi:hypothetical protein
MTPISHTLYTLTLFLALSALKLWSDRHHRDPALLKPGDRPDVPRVSRHQNRGNVGSVPGF